MPTARALLVAVVLAGCAAPGASGLLEAASLACPTPCAMTLDAPGGYAWEPYVAVDQTDPHHIVAAWTRFVDAPLAESAVHDILVVTSRDGGATWSSVPIPHGADAPPGSPLASRAILADPWVGFLPDGTLVCTGLAIDGAVTPGGNVGTGFLVFSVVSRDGGASFETPVVVADGLTLKTQTLAGNRGLVGQAPDFPVGAVLDDGTLLVTFRSIDQATPGDTDRSVLMISLSRDGAASWSTPARIETPTRDAMSWSTLETRSGAWLLALATFDETASPVAFRTSVARSTDRGGTWSFTDIGSGTFSGGFVETAEGIALVRPDGGEPERVVASFSRDDGLSWGSDVVLAEAPQGTSFPTAAGDGTHAYVSHFARGSDDRYSLRLLAFTPDGPGEPTTLREGLTRPPAETGEYFGLAALPDGAFAAWTTDEDTGRLEGARATRRAADADMT